MKLEHMTYDEIIKVALARPEGDELRILAEKADEKKLENEIADSGG